MNAAAFKATYSDFRLIKGRKVVQFVFELPIEQADVALKVVGGMPNPAAEVWCAVARLDPTKIESEVVPTEGRQRAPRETGTIDTSPASVPDIPARAINRLAQRAGILCNDPLFHRYLGEKHHVQQSHDRQATTLLAAAFVRNYCKVESRADILPNTEAATRLDLLESAFVCWRDVPEMADAS